MHHDLDIHPISEKVLYSMNLELRTRLFIIIRKNSIKKHLPEDEGCAERFPYDVVDELKKNLEYDIKHEMY